MDKATRAKHEESKRARSEVNKRTAVLRTARISPERRRRVAYTPSRATSCTPAPAARAICAPLPGFISMQCTVEPTGMLRSGRVLPALIGASRPAITWSPAFRPFGAMM